MYSCTRRESGSLGGEGGTVIDEGVSEVFLKQVTFEKTPHNMEKPALQKSVGSEFQVEGIKA